MAIFEICFSLQPLRLDRRRHPSAPPPPPLPPTNIVMDPKTCVLAVIAGNVTNVVVVGHCLKCSNEFHGCLF